MKRIILFLFSLRIILAFGCVENNNSKTNSDNIIIGSTIVFGTSTGTNSGTTTGTSTGRSTGTSTGTATSGGYSVTTFAGYGTAGDADGTGISAKFYYPQGIAIDSSGNIFIADSYNHKIKKITSSGIVTTFAGSGTIGIIDDVGTNARFNYPSGLAFDSIGNLYVADTENYSIRKISPSGVVTTFAGLSGSKGYTDGTCTSARFAGPSALAFDSSGNLYVTDWKSGYFDGFYASSIRKITTSGVVSTFAGPNYQGSSGIIGNSDGYGASAKFNYPSGLSVDSSGNVFVADTYNHSIRKITSAGTVTTIAGSTSGISGTTDGNWTTARFNYPKGIAIDSAGNMHIVDSSNNEIRKMTSAGVVTTIAGSTQGSSDGVGTNALFNFPHGVAIDSSGNLYITDSYNHKIRKIVP